MSDQPKPDEPKRPGFFKRLFGQDEPVAPAPAEVAIPEPAPPAESASPAPAEPKSWWRRLTEWLSLAHKRAAGAGAP